MRLALSTALLVYEIDAGRINLSLNAVSLNKVRVDRIELKGTVQRLQFGVFQPGSGLEARITAHFDSTVIKYNHTDTEQSHAHVKHDLSLVWHSNNLRAKKSMDVLISDKDQLYFIANRATFLLASIHSELFVNLLKLIINTRYITRDDSTNNHYLKFLKQNILTTPVFNPKAVDSSLQLPTPNADLQSYTMTNFFQTINNGPATTVVVVYHEPNRWRQFNDPKSNQLQPSFNLLHRVRISGKKLEYDLVGSAMQGDATIDEVLNPSISLAKPSRFSPVVDPTASTWPWRIVNFTMAHHFGEEFTLSHNQPQLVQQHLFELNFTLE
jgi:hypothetical protein